MSKTSFRAALVTALISISAISACKQEDNATTAVPESDPVAEITAIEKEMEALYNSPEFPRNPSIIHPYLSPDMTLIDIMEPTRFQGAEALAHADEIGATFQGKVEFRNINVTATEQMGYVEYIQYFFGTDINGNAFEMPLYTTDIFQKIDGKWKMVHQAVNLPMDMETVQKLMAPKNSEE